VLQDPFGADLQLSLRPHRQREQIEQGVEIGMLAQLLQAQPNHAINKYLQLTGQLVWAEFEAPMGQHNNQGQMQHLWVKLEKAGRLRPEAVLEALLSVHLHHQQYHRVLRSAYFPT